MSNTQMNRPASWTEDGTSADNTADTITHAAETGVQHFVCGMSVAADEAAVVLVTIEDNDVVIWRKFVHNEETIVFDNPLEISRGKKVDVEIAAAGSGIATNCSLWGFSN